jgi:citronellol/citronellal dehydrogenase
VRSSYSWAGTLDVPVKRYDLMQGVNTRGTFITSQACLPYLIESAKKGTYHPRTSRTRICA